MPELPEVETIRRVVEPQIRGCAIENVLLQRPEIIAHPDAETLCKQLQGQVFSGMARRGKYLIFSLEGGARILLHLRMTGCLLVAQAECPAEKHTHIVFCLNGGRQLRFSDVRRFGRLWLLQKGERDCYSGMEKLGLEPFDPGICAEYFLARWGQRKRAIKECLLEQNVVAGIGNIYSDEILFAAKIHPARPASALTQADWERLAAAIPAYLRYFIEKNRISPEEYWQTKGQDYRNTPFLRVYGRAGQACAICGASLQRIAIGGRSSVFCPVCQGKT